MSVNRPVLLMTRPRSSAEKFVASFDPNDIHAFDVCFSPLIGIVPRLDVSLNRDYAGSIFTSKNGVEAARRLSLFVSGDCFCVGHATTNAAIEFGWQAQFAGQSASHLIETIIALKPPAPLVHLSGKHRRGNIALKLSEAGILTDAICVYDQPAQPLTDEAKSLLKSGRPIIAPFFSPRSAEIFANRYSGVGDLHVVAMSQPVAEKISNLDFSSLEIVTRPDAQNMKRGILNALSRLTRVEGAQDAQ